VRVKQGLLISIVNYIMYKIAARSLRSARAVIGMGDHSLIRWSREWRTSIFELSRDATEEDESHRSRYKWQSTCWSLIKKGSISSGPDRPDPLSNNTNKILFSQFEKIFICQNSLRQINALPRIRYF